jgi:hypothetical protein
MRVKAWIEISKEIEVDVSVKDISAALDEAFTAASGNEPNARNVLLALNDIAQFLKGISDEQIRSMQPSPRALVAEFLGQQAARFAAAGARA